MAEALDFGDVGVGGVRRSTIEIANRGGADLTVTDSRHASGTGPFAVTGSPALPAPVGPNTEIQVEVAFGPMAAALATDRLEIASDDADRPIVSVLMSGTGLSFGDQAAALVEGLDEGVAAGVLAGNGPGNSAPGRPARCGTCSSASKS